MKSLITFVLLCAIPGCMPGPVKAPSNDKPPSPAKSALSASAESSVPAYRAGLAKAARDTMAQCDTFQDWKQMFKFFQDSSKNSRENAFGPYEQAMTDRLLVPKGAPYDAVKAKAALSEAAEAWESK